MTLAKSRLTAPGQTSVPAEDRRRLGVGPGSIVGWVRDGDRVVVRRVGRNTSDEVHKAAFPDVPPALGTLTQLKEGLRRHVRERHARR